MSTRASIAAVAFLLLALTAVCAWSTQMRHYLDSCKEAGGHYTTTATGRDIVCVGDDGRIIQP